jgi:hypothetical protein
MLLDFVIRIIVVLQHFLAVLNSILSELLSEERNIAYLEERTPQEKNLECLDEQLGKMVGCRYWFITSLHICILILVL